MNQYALWMACKPIWWEGAGSLSDVKAGWMCRCFAELFMVSMLGHPIDSCCVQDHAWSSICCWINRGSPWNRRACSILSKWCSSYTKVQNGALIGPMAWQNGTTCRYMLTGCWRQDWMPCRGANHWPWRRVVARTDAWPIYLMKLENACRTVIACAWVTSLW